MRQNKGSILKASVDYIRKLKVDQQRKRAVEEKMRLQEATNRRLLLKIQEYEAQMKAYGIPVQSYSWKQASAAPGDSSFDKGEPAASAVASPSSLLSAAAAAAASAVLPPKAPPTPDHLHEACHLSTKQLEDLMDDDCSGTQSLNRSKGSF